jgi:putative transcriptional regulator
MTQQKLANAIYVSRQTIVTIEKEKYSPSLEVFFKIAIYLKTDKSGVFLYKKSVNTSYL